MLLLLVLGCGPEVREQPEPTPGPGFEDGPAFEALDPLDSGLLTPVCGGGVAVRDLDGDGLPELMLTDFAGSRLYRNLGDFRFEPWPSQPWLEDTRKTMRRDRKSVV